MSEPQAQPRPFRVDRRWALLAVILVAVLLGSLVLVTRLAAKGGPSEPPPTTWQLITSGIRDTGVPKDVALEAFAYLYKVTIPGVAVPSGVEGGDEPTSGTGALRWVQSHWSELTPDQQAVIDRYRTNGPNDLVLTFDASSAGGQTGSTILPAVARLAPPDGRTFPQAESDLADALKADMIADIQRIGQHLGLKVIPNGAFLWANVSLDLSDQDGGDTLMHTDAVENGIGAYSPCNVKVFKNTWQGETASGGKVSDRLHVLMTHEVVHCYQNVVWGDVGTALAMPPWIAEGTALYLAADDTKIEEPMIPSMWTKGYFVPETPLTNRSYDAFGWFSLLAHKGRDLWGQMVLAWAAAGHSSQRSDAFIAVLKGDADDVRDDWAPSYVRQDSWNDPWIAYGFGLPPGAQVIHHQADAIPPPGYTGSLQSRSNTVIDVVSSDGPVVEVTTSGLASAHDSAGHQALAFTSQRFCVEGDCICPQGTELAGQRVADTDMSLAFTLAFNAPEGGSTYSIAGRTLEDLCRKLPTPHPTPPPLPCVTGCPGSNGDPHLKTSDGTRYDFQAAGEYTLLRSPDDSLELQGRQEPFQDSPASINTAIAVKVAGHRVGVYATGTGLTTRIDGKVTDLNEPVTLAEGASVTSYPGGVEVDAPDGTRIWSLSVRQWGINAIVSPSPLFRIQAVGLLGLVPRGGMAVPALPDGSPLPSPPDQAAYRQALYGPLADAWRVTDQTSLFDYDAGKTTTNYSVAGFPPANSPTGTTDLTPDQLAAGEAACAGISDPDLHDECVFDVGLSGQAGFADSYEATESFQENGTSALETGGSSSATPTPATTGTGTAIKVATVYAVAGTTSGPDGTIYASIAAAPGQASLDAIDPVTGTIEKQVPIPVTSLLRVAGDALWATDLQGLGGTSCHVTRFDPKTLAEGATVEVPCGFAGAEVATDGEALWVFDPGTGGAGQTVDRIDPATNQLEPGIPLPVPDQLLFDSNGAIFYGDSGAKVWRHSVGAAGFDLMGDFPGKVYPAGTGIWAPDADGAIAELWSGPSGGPSAQVGLPQDARIIAADPDGVWASVPGFGLASPLTWIPVGKASSSVGQAPLVDGMTLEYFVGRPHVTPDALVMLWVPIAPAGEQDTALYLQRIPTP